MHRINFLTYLFIMVAAVVSGDSLEAQTTQQVTIGSREYGSSLRAGVRGTGVGGISVGTRIPYATMNQPGGQPAASVRRIGGRSGGGTVALPNSGGINPLLQSGALTVPIPSVGGGPLAQPVPRPQAYNPYTGQSYGSNSKGGSAAKPQAVSKTPTVPGHYAFPVSGGASPRTR